MSHSCGLHCIICDFCSTVPAARNYVTDLTHHGNVVVYFAPLKDYYCHECIERIGIWRRTYKDEAAQFIDRAEALLDNALEEETEHHEPNETHSDALALSEV